MFPRRTDSLLGYRNNEAASAAGGAIDTNGAAVPVDDTPANSESESGALARLLRCEEWFEYAFP
jgi:hypothetical protein